MHHNLQVSNQQKNHLLINTKYLLYRETENTEAGEGALSSRKTLPEMSNKPH